VSDQVDVAPDRSPRSASSFCVSAQNDSDEVTLHELPNPILSPDGIVG
jgi:hypothetical protein